MLFYMAKKGFTDVIKDLGMGGCPELSGWAQSNPKGPLEREARGPLSERKDEGGSQDGTPAMLCGRF